MIFCAFCTKSLCGSYSPKCNGCLQLYLLLRKHKNQYFAAIDKNVSICTKMYETALFCNVQKYMKCTKMYENVQNVQKCTKQHYFAMCNDLTQYFAMCSDLTKMCVFSIILFKVTIFCKLQWFDKKCMFSA